MWLSQISVGSNCDCEALKHARHREYSTRYVTERRFSTFENAVMRMFTLRHK